MSVYVRLGPDLGAEKPICTFNNTNHPAAALAQVASASSAPREEATQEQLGALVTWLAARGVGVGSVKFAPGAPGMGGSGVYAARDLAPGELVLAVPLESAGAGGGWEPVAITLDLVRAQAGPLAAAGRALAFTGAEGELRRLAGAPASDGGYSTADLALLSLGLLVCRQQGAASPWAAYLATLPPANGSPLLWSEAEREELQGTAVLEEVEERRDGMRAAWATLFPTLSQLDPVAFPPGDFTAELWAWAFTTVAQRAVTLPQQSTLALVPGFDLINHAPGSPMLLLEEPPGSRAGLASARWAAPAVSLRAPPGGLAVGEQIFHDYAPHDMASQLLNYGFVAFRPEDDGGPVCVELDMNACLFEGDELNGARLTVLAAHGLCTRPPRPRLTFLPTANGEDGVRLPVDFLPLARGLSLSADDFRRGQGQ